MHTYIGTKMVKAMPMTRFRYNNYRGWNVPVDEDDEEGYLVEYFDGGSPNHSAHKGYISWSPKGVFEEAYLDLGEGPQAMTRLPHQYRVVVEKAQLDANIEKLRVFMVGTVFRDLYAAEQDRLQDQLRTMLNLSDILAERIEAFNDPL